MKNENRVQKTLLYKAQMVVRFTFFIDFHRVGLYIVTLSERHFRFPKSQVILCITKHFEKRKTRSGNVAILSSKGGPIYFFMNFNRFGLYIVTLSETSFRFPRSQIILCITKHLKSQIAFRKRCYIKPKRLSDLPFSWIIIDLDFI